MRALFCCWQKKKKKLLKKTCSLTVAGQNGQIFLFKLTDSLFALQVQYQQKQKLPFKGFQSHYVLNKKKCLQKCYIVVPLGVFIWSNGSVFNKQLRVLLLLVLISQFNNISNHLKWLQYIGQPSLLYINVIMWWQTSHSFAERLHRGVLFFFSSPHTVCRVQKMKGAHSFASDQHKNSLSAVAGA